MATVANVAHRAGVSAATAARVLSGRGYASEKTRQAVLEAAKEIGYVPNHVARSLRTRRTMLAGLLIGDVENSFYAVIAKKVESVAKEAGYQVVLCNSNDDPETEKQYLQLLDGIQVDGLVITPTGRNQRYLRPLLEKGTVIVQIDRMVDGVNADAVLLDNEAGAMAAVSHLIPEGHSRIGILTGPREMLTARERLEGYERALREHGIPVRPELIKAGSFLHDHAIEAATELLRSRPPPTAIFAVNNVLVEGCFLALGGLGLSVPADVSLVAFDDVPWMSMVSPQLTTIRQPVADMARSAAELLLRRLKDNGPAPSTSVFRSELVIRGPLVVDVGGSVGDRQIAARRHHIHQRGHDLAWAIGVRDVLQHQQHHDRHGLAEVQRPGGFPQDRAGVPGVGFHVVGGALGGAVQQRAGVREGRSPRRR